jgi:RNA polymerase sigma factor (TIGR02999 family)
MSDVTQILQQIDRGDLSAAEKLLPLVYQELRRLAAARMAHESPDHTLQATALVHEAYLRLVGGDQPQQWSGRGHFFGAAAEAMRRILVESARHKRRIKAGGEARFLSLDNLQLPAPNSDNQLLEVDDALCALACEDPLAARVVELKYFGGLDHEEVAAVLRVTVYRARQKWTYARAWLRERLALSENSPRNL